MTLRGELSRWLVELHSGVFVGHVSALVRDALIDRCRAGRGTGGFLVLYPAQNEQGFRVYRFGKLSREPLDWEGLTLVRKQNGPPRRTGKGQVEGDSEEPPF